MISNTGRCEPNPGSCQDCRSPSAGTQPPSDSVGLHSTEPPIFGRLPCCVSMSICLSSSCAEKRWAKVRMRPSASIGIVEVVRADVARAFVNLAIDDSAWPSGGPLVVEPLSEPKAQCASAMLLIFDRRAQDRVGVEIVQPADGAAAAAVGIRQRRAVGAESQPIIAAVDWRARASRADNARKRQTQVQIDNDFIASALRLWWFSLSRRRARSRPLLCRPAGTR